MVRIHVDVDDTLADTTTMILHYLKIKHNIILDRTKLVYPNYLDVLFKSYSTRIVRDFENSEFHKEIAPLQNSIEMIRKLAEKHELIIISGRRLDLKEKTIDWLSKFFPKCFKDVHLVNHFPNEGEERGLPKDELCKKLNCDFSIDDDVNVALKIASYGIKVLLMNQPWNASYEIKESNITRVNNWEEIYKAIENNNK